MLGCIAVALPVFAQTDGSARTEEVSDKSIISSNSNKEFWVCFMKNYRNDLIDPLLLELFITSATDAKVTIVCQGLNFKRIISVKAGTVASVTIDEKAQLDSSPLPQRKAFHITSDAPISVYGLNHRAMSTDSYLAIPVSVLGTAYRAIGYSKLGYEFVSEFAVIATEDSTQVTITPTTPTTDKHPENIPYTVYLKRGEVYQVMSEYDVAGTADFTGTLITSNKKIAVFSGHSCAYVPVGVGTCNHLVEQMPPLSTWGKHYYVGTLQRRSAYTLRVLASEPRTRVFEDSKLVAVLEAGEFYESIRVTRNVQITADKPVMVVQYSQGFKNRDSVGDPMMIVVSPTQQFYKNYRFATPVNGAWDHYVNIVVPTEAIPTLKLDGERMQISDFTPLSLSRYSIAQKQVTFGTHTITCEEPIGLYSYGFGYGSDAFDAYGTMGSQSFMPLPDAKDTLPPLHDSKRSKGGLNVIIRDDRTADRGLKTVKVLFAQGLVSTLPSIEEGTPQVQFLVKPITEGTEGKMVIQSTDAAANKSVFTVCYTYDNKTEQFGFRLCPEGEDCDDSPVWNVGAFITYNSSLHSANFSKAGAISAPGTFGEASGGGGYFGFLVSRKLSKRLTLSGRLSVETIGGELRAPDSSLSRIRTVLPDGKEELVNSQEERILSLTSPMLSIAFLAEVNVLKSLYLIGGARALISMSDAISYKRRILQPDNYVYAENRQREISETTDNLGALNNLRIGLVSGLGFSVPLNPKFTLFAEAMYTYPLGDMLTQSNGTWSVSHINVNSGVKIRL
ncbi:MAG: IgGFc-binding protein [Candidatus Kapabacteria bacterium]|nr:IgGFc-binding protein [Candidatus Kapabacteria bacterium]